MGVSYSSVAHRDTLLLPTHTSTSLLPPSPEDPFVSPKIKKTTNFKMLLSVLSMVLSVLSLCIWGLFNHNQLKKNTSPVIILFSPFLNQGCFEGYLSIQGDPTSLLLSNQPFEFHMLFSDLGNIKISEINNFSFLPINNHFGWFLICAQINQSIYFLDHDNYQFVYSLLPPKNLGFYLTSPKLNDVYDVFHC